jgi:hypothetical protein
MEEKKPEKKGLLTKLKENVDDHYVELPMVKKPLGASSDITFVASIFTGALATFGLSTGNGKKNGNGTTTTTKPKT